MNILKEIETIKIISKKINLLEINNINYMVDIIADYNYKNVSLFDIHIAYWKDSYPSFNNTDEDLCIMNKNDWSFYKLTLNKK